MCHFPRGNPVLSSVCRLWFNAGTCLKTLMNSVTLSVLPDASNAITLMDKLALILDSNTKSHSPRVPYTTQPFQSLLVL